ncbi:MAG TPA: exosortase A [Candidatus Eisenbacteria bacterium]|nr:exosortase A [Candidatus Eisenbacteria bacterium]
MTDRPGAPRGEALAGAKSPALAVHPGWPRLALVAIPTIAILLLLYRDTLSTIAGIWWRSETFTHGFFVAPAALLVAWRLRRRVATTAPVPAPALLAAVAMAALLWTLARVAGIQGIEQAAFVTLLVASIVALIGTEAARALAFPLAFLFLMVPFGEIFVPTLIEYTARFTVAALRLTGIPVARDGDLFRIPGGTWRVVEACSGLRYLIASFTLGWFFAWWTFGSLRRRIVFVGLAIAVPIVANWVRAYLIVMIGYLSDMKLATGVDHIIYGWIFFSLVMAALFFAGRIWADRVRETGPDLDTPLEPSRPGGKGTGSAAGGRAPFLLALALVAIAAAGPIYAAILEGPRADVTASLPAPEPREGWTPAAESAPPWTPDVSGCDAVRETAYLRDASVLWLYTGFFADQRQDHELINTQNVLVSTRNRQWRKAAEWKRNVETEEGPVEVMESFIRSPGEDGLVWSWYWVAGERSADPMRAKWSGVKARLLRRSDAAALIAVYTPAGSDTTEARRRLAAFVRAMLPSIDSSLRAANQSVARGSTRS